MSRSPNTPRAKTVAVVGAGIAGMGAAWALHRAGVTVAVYERAATLGGNAKTHVWSFPSGDLRTGLSVLAWPQQYFHNYEALLRELDVPTEPAPPLSVFVRRGEDVWAPGVDTAMWRRHAGDLERWRRLVDALRRWNARFAEDPSRPSLYESSPLNPLNLVPLLTLWRRYGISEAFWRNVFVPTHSASFLTVELDRLPAVIAPTIEDIMPLGGGGRLQTWSRSSADVFARLARGMEDRVRTGRSVERIERDEGGVTVRDATGDRERFDAVVLACPAPVAFAMLAPTPLERWLLSGVSYSDEHDPTFAKGVIHSDASLLPPEHRRTILDGYANYVEVSSAGRVANTFVLSSWLPAARAIERPLMVSYHHDGAIDAPEGEVSNRLAHPALEPRNLVRAMLLRRLQGRRRTWYCSSYTTPANGHDLSLLSGLVVAGALGAPYPFDGDELAKRDYERLRRWMLG